MDVQRLVAGLDGAQQRAVTNPHRPLAIVAPAGSGKTRVLTRRLAYLAATDVIDARRALCLSFTREAAGELRTRLAALGLRELPAAGTFHAIAYALLRLYWSGRRLREPELLVDRRSYLVRLFPSLSSAERTRLESELSWAKARGLDPRSYVRASRGAGRRPPGGFGATNRMFARYEEACERAHLVDFDDLLARCAHAFETDAGFAAAQRWRFQHLFVDEFQDVNPLQFRLLKAWLGDGDDVCVVGDERQAIYGWNGADAGYLVRFADYFPGAVIERLDRNYRSTPQVVAVAAAALADEEAAPLAEAGDGPPPLVTSFENEIAEARGLLGWSRARYHEGIGWSSQAILTRTNALARRVVEALRAGSIPARLLLARPSGGQLATLAAMARTAPSLAVLLADAASGTLELEDADQQLLVELAREYLAVDPTGTPQQFATWLVGPATAARQAPGITVATFHAAKGLEWRAVHVAGLVQGLVPTARASTPEAIAEERRLLHVALSRATVHLTCSWTRQRDRDGERYEREASPFLASVEAACTRQVTASAAVPPPATYRLQRPRHVARQLDRTVEAVDGWRRRQAQIVGAPAAAVLSDAAVHEVALQRPSTVEALAELPGIGVARAQRLGPSLLAALHSVEISEP
jgi:DNA helicase-2/ATP-dependent DNA helicase PcrA